jgi:hypothetical protein
LAVIVGTSSSRNEISWAVKVDGAMKAKKKKPKKKGPNNFGKMKKKKFTTSDDFDWLNLAAQLPSSGKQKAN